MLALVLLAVPACVLSSEQTVEVPDDYTTDEYYGRKWHIDDVHDIYWNGRVYRRYGFTGAPSSGTLEDLLDTGIDHFNLGAGVAGYVFAGNGKARREDLERVDELSNRVTTLGGTYYAALHTLLPWSGSGDIPDGARVPWLERSTTDVTRYAGTRSSLELKVPVSDDLSKHTDEGAVKVFLFDGDTKNRLDLTEKVVSTAWSRTKSGTGSEGYELSVRLAFVDLPDSSSLRVTVAAPTSRETLFAPHLPAMWKEEVREHFERSLERYRDAYQKRGLRGLCFCAEVAVPDIVPFAGSMEDFTRDATVMKSYRNFLRDAYDDDIASLNKRLGASYGSFDEIPWHTDALPYRDLQELEDAGELYGIYPSVESAGRIQRVQNEFRHEFYGSLFAEYARVAKRAVGNVPVFTTTGSVKNADDPEIELHFRAMLHGVDGLSRNCRGTLANDEKLGYRTIGGQDLEGIAERLARIANEAGATKAYLANALRWETESAPENPDRAPTAGFPSKEKMRQFLEVMNDHGYGGYHLEVEKPGKIWSHDGDDEETLAVKQEMEWFGDLKDEIVRRAVYR
jgi:hypothetical protein